ncbi:MAG: ABC transporter substrate binding protein [Thermodesulfobacteriota bacterium]|nr:ABC transporter substrate binding protein [Thermodesulfobacteriota bacterium]
MHKSIKRLVFLLLFLCLLDLSASSGTADEKHVLVLHSYHQGLAWTDHIMQGMMAELESAGLDLDIHVEYMDTKRHPPSIVFPLLKDYYRRKYQSHQFDVILLSDNNALDFLLSVRKELFPGVPVVFCGVNNYDKSLIGGHKGVTGVTEGIDISGTIRLAARILPEVRHIIAITDLTTSGRANRRKFEQAMAGSDNTGFSFEIWDDLTATGLQQRLSELSRDSVVLPFTFHRDKSGQYFSAPEYLKLIIDNCPVPIFSFWEPAVGQGFMGGVMVCGKAQGKHAAAYAIRIINGRSPASLPVLMESSNVPFLDYRVLAQFDVPMERIPEGAVVLHAPVPLFQKHRNVILVSGIVIVLLMSVVFLLWINLLVRRRSEAALRESEARNRSLLESLPDIIMRFDRDGRHLYVSENIEAATGIRAADCIGKTLAEMGFPEEKSRLWQGEIKQVFDSADPVETEVTYGQTIFNWRLIPERDRYGTVESVLSISRDITEHRRIEQDYRTLFREMLGGFALHEIICDASGVPVDYRFLAVNPAFERMTGLKAGDIVGRRILEVLPGTEHSWIETYGKVALTGEPIFFENYASELQKYFEVTAYRPAPNQFACIFQDITARKQAEDAVRESEARFKALHNASFGGIAIHDKGVILDCNEGLATISGYSVSELIGMDGLLLIAEEYREKVMGNILAGYEKPYEVKAVRKNGEEYPVRLEARNIPYKGQMVRSVEFRDITETKKIEAQLAQSQKMESVGRLAGGVAHDFNNMLGIILGHVDMIVEQLAPDDPLYENLHEIQTAAERSANLVRQLLAFARQQTIAPRVLELNTTMDGMLRMLQRLIGEDIELVWLPGPALWPIRIDPSQMDQVLANLCVNARDAIKGVGKVTIATANISLNEDDCRNSGEAAVPGDYVVMMFSDDGAGMDEKTMANLFEPFFTTKEVGEGTGLGMATIYGIVKQNDGFINVDSAPGKGTTVKVFFPRYRQHAVEPMQTDTHLSPVSANNETVLLVEDEASMLKMIKTMLEGLGYRVLTAATAKEAIDISNAPDSGKIHLLITDVVMPKMNGRDLAQALSTTQPDLKCLFISGYTADAIARHGVLEEGISFISKPFTRQVLAAKIRDVLDGKQSADMK